MYPWTELDIAVALHVLALEVGRRAAAGVILNAQLRRDSSHLHWHDDWIKAKRLMRPEVVDRQLVGDACWPEAAARMVGKLEGHGAINRAAGGARLSGEHVHRCMCIGASA